MIDYFSVIQHTSNLYKYSLFSYPYFSLFSAITGSGLLWRRERRGMRGMIDYEYVIPSFPSLTPLTTQSVQKRSSRRT